MPAIYFVSISTCVPRSTGPSYLGDPAGRSLSSSIGTVSARGDFFVRRSARSAVPSGTLRRSSPGPLSIGPRVRGPQVRKSRMISAIKIRAAAATIALVRPEASAFVFRRGAPLSAPRNRFGYPSLFRMVWRQGVHSVYRRPGLPCTNRRNMFHGRRPEVKTKKRRDTRPAAQLWEISALRRANHSAYIASITSL